MRMVSLGRRCEVVWQLRRFFGCEQALPFDWWVTPLQSIVAVIDDDFSKLVDPQHLSVSVAYHPFKPEFRGETIRNTHYELFLHHDFERTGLMIASGWRDAIGAVRRKYDHIVGTWHDLLRSGEPITLVRQGGCLTLPNEAPIETSASDFVCVLDAVQAKSRGPVRMVVLDCDRLDLDDRFIQAKVGRPNASDWSSIDEYWCGSNARWDRLLTDLASR